MSEHIAHQHYCVLSVTYRITLLKNADHFDVSVEERKLSVEVGMFEVSLELFGDLSEKHVVQVLKMFTLHYIYYLHEIVLDFCSF